MIEAPLAPNTAQLQNRIFNVLKRIAVAEALANRAGQTALLAVSKTFGADAVRAAFNSGLRAFGENYVQEGTAKVTALSDLRNQISWHFIGPLQSNKTRDVAAHFDWVHTVDRLKIAQRLSEQRPAHLAPLDVCIQVNIDNAPTKSGVPPRFDTIFELCQQIVALPRLQLRGLMAIPDATPIVSPHAGSTIEPDPTASAEAAIGQKFEHLRELHAQLNAHGIRLDTLSMGMSADLETAIAHGSTMVRVGSALFGSRS